MLGLVLMYNVFVISIICNIMSSKPVQIKILGSAIDHNMLGLCTHVTLLIKFK